MKKHFSPHWKSSSQPRKQRKYIANAPIHIKRKMLSVNLTKELRKKYGKRNTPVKKGDLVKIMRGKFKKKQGKIIEVNTKSGKIYIEGILAKKRDGSSVKVPLKSSNLQIIELNMDTKRGIEKSPFFLLAERKSSGKESKLIVGEREKLNTQKNILKNKEEIRK